MASLRPLLVQGGLLPHLACAPFFLAVLGKGDVPQPPGLCPAGPKLPSLLGPGLCLQGWPWQTLEMFAEGSPKGLPRGPLGTWLSHTC